MSYHPYFCANRSRNLLISSLVGDGAGDARVDIMIEILERSIDCYIGVLVNSDIIDIIMVRNNVIYINVYTLR